MLEAALEQLLLRYLAPYVDGISRDKLHVGVFSGCLELKDLRVKPDALALLGLEGFRARSGSIRMIRLNVPLSRIVNCKLRVVVQVARLEVEQIGDASTPERSEAELIEEVRDAKRKAVELRMAQLRDLLEQQREQAEAAEASGQGGSYAVKLLRRIVNNIQIDLADLRVAFVSRSRGLACGVELPILAVRSTDQTFRERAETEEVNITGSSMYKLMRLHGLGVRMSAAGSCSLDGAEHVLSPISASLQLAHVPSDQILRVRVEVATREVAELTLLRSQVKHLRSVQAASLAEVARLRALLVPPEEERTIYLDPLAAAREYAFLYEQKLSFEWKVHGHQRRPLSPAEASRAQLLEDVLSVRILAKQRWLVHNKLEAVNEEMARRQREIERARVQAERRKAGLFKRVADYVGTSDGIQPFESGALWLSVDEQKQLLQDLGGESKVEAVDLPSRLKIEFVLGKMALELVDDRWPDDVRRQLLSLALQEANWTVDVDMATDHRGQDSSEWRVECCLSAFRALHAGRISFRFRPPEHPGEEAGDDLGLDGANAAKLVLENKLEPDQNLLRLRFGFAPMEVHMLPGVLEQLLEFIRAPEAAEGLTRVGLEDVMGMSKELVAAHGDTAKEVAERVYEQIPDRVHLDIRIASPSIRVPVEGLGAATFSLGHLRLSTPDPCAYNSIDLAIGLNSTSLQAVSTRGERFNVIQPVPVNVSIKYRAFDDENSLEVQVRFQEVALSLAPQALQILIATPGAVASIMSMAEPTPQAVLPAEGGAQEAERPTFSELLHEVLGEDNAGVEAAARRLGEVSAKQFRLNLTAQLDALDVTLSDSIVPVLRFHSRMLQPGLVMYWQSTPSILSVDIDDSLLEVEALRVQTNAWEPLVERLRVGLQVVCTPEGADGCATHVVVSGHEPLLLNLTPSAVRRACWILPLFASSLRSPPSEQKADAAVEACHQAPFQVGTHGTKYRVVNLCDYPLELEFRSRHRTGLVMQVNPTGSSWESLDEWVLPHFTTAVAARVPGGRASEALLLERPDAAPVPDSSAVAELFAPSHGQRLLLLATPLRVHNRTDFPMVVRFHDALQREVLMVDVPRTALCDAALLGLEPPERSVTEVEAYATPAEPPEGSSVVLPPNAVCAVPAPAMIRARGALSSACAAAATVVAAAPRVWISTRPTSLPMGFSAVVETGAGVGPRAVACPRTVDGVAKRNDGVVGEGLDSVSFVCESLTYLAGPSASVSLTTLVLRPPLALLNALPIGSLTVGYAPGIGGKARGQAWREVNVPRFARLNLYSFVGLPSEGGVSVCARLEDGAPWSPVARFEASIFGADFSGQAGQVLPLRQTPDGAAAGLLAEACGHYEMRFSCPNWFIDRSGLSRPLVLELLRDGHLLPHADGITLLPNDCLEEHCTLLLRSACSNFAVHSMRMPPSWSTLAWRTPCGPFVFCLQTDDVATGDVLGAHCQVTTLRPRLVLTNASPCDIELQLGENKLLRLASGQSLESHWPVAQGEEDLPATSLRFRPLREVPCPWSGVVLCADSVAGSTPLLLPGSTEGSADQPGSRVWSVEVAPERGALAVSLRCGSDFVVVNRAVRMQARMSVRPLGGRGPPPEIAVQPGEEAEYGWTQPFVGKREWSVEVQVSGMRCRIADVRRTIRRVLRPAGVVLAAARRGSQTLLVLEDYEPSTPSSMGGRQQAAEDPPAEGVARSGGPSWLQRVEVKLSHMGISLVDEVPRPARELLYLHLDLVRLEWRQNEDDVQQLKLAISDLQVDCQLPGRVDARTSDRRRDESLGLLHRERPAVIFANCGDGDRAFLSLLVQRCATSSRDLLLPYAEIALDAMDVTIDDGWLDPLADFLSRAWPEHGAPRGVPVSEITSMAGQPIIEGYAAPPLPPVVQVDALHISSICLTVWCILKLKSVHFLPAYLRGAIRVLSFSGKLTLDGAVLALPARRLPSHRGSLTDFLLGLGNEYTVNLLNNAGSVLGKSSVLNLPRVPLKIGGTAVSYLTDSMGLVAGEAASLLSQLTFDEEYVAQQRHIRSDKRIRSIGDGVVEAGKSLVQGVEGILDVVKKPVEGASRSGLGGFLAGVGKGVAGSFVKPISKLGQAISDVGSGIAAQVTPDSASMKRRRARLRQREPRLLFSAHGTLRPWSELEAELLHQLGDRLMHGVEEVIPLTQHGPQRTVLTLFPHRLLVLQVQGPAEAASQHRARGSCSSGGSSSSRSAPASSSSGGGQRKAAGGAPPRPPDFVDAMDETAFKLFLQALKPINTLVYGVQDLRHIGAKAGGRTQLEHGPGPGPAGRALGVRFADLRAVHAADTGGVLQLEDLQGGVVSLPLFAAPLGEAAREALVEGFRAALADKGRRASWEELRKALEAERRSRWHQPNQQDGVRHPGVGSGERTLEVLEVERRNPAVAEWQTPFLPTDGELSWRWVDATGCKHPHLIQHLSRREAASSRSPPCRLDSLFRSSSEWVLDVNADTDAEGWRYGLAWNASTWDSRPGILDGLRKRRWTRTYV